MPNKKSPAARPTKTAPRSLDADAESVLVWLKRHGTQRTLDSMARFAIHSDNAFGVTVADLRKYAKGLGRDHALALALWDTGRYEARLLASLIDEPARVTPAQMDRWTKDFDNWAVCDTVCFHLFDRTPHAWAKVQQWSTRKPEFERRAAFAVLWGLTVHDKLAADEPFLQALAIVERSAADQRRYVKMAVNMALRAIGKRNLALHAAAVAVAERLADSENATARWVGKDALRELSSSSVRKRVATRHA